MQRQVYICHTISLELVCRHEVEADATYLLGNLEIPTMFFPEHLAWINAMADTTYIAS